MNVVGNCAIPLCIGNYLKRQKNSRSQNIKFQLKSVVEKHLPYTTLLFAQKNIERECDPPSPLVNKSDGSKATVNKSVIYSFFPNFNPNLETRLTFSYP